MSDYVYVIAMKRDDGWLAPVKVGISTTPKERLSSLQSGSPVPLTIYHLFRLHDRESCRHLERAILEIQSEHRLHGEWLNLAPITAASILALYIASRFMDGVLTYHEVRPILVEMGALPPEEGPFVPNFGKLP
jgi:hypothetical protein